MVAQMAGTERVWEETEYDPRPPSRVAPGAGARGGWPSSYIVHPNEIKTLPTGTAMCMTKLPTADVQRVQVTPRSAHRRRQRGRSRPTRSAGGGALTARRRGGAQPVAGGTQPVAGGAQPVADGTQPVADGTQPLAAVLSRRRG